MKVTEYRCDRCGTVMEPPFTTISRGHVAYELCNGCHHDFYDRFLKNLPLTTRQKVNADFTIGAGTK